MFQAIRRADPDLIKVNIDAVNNKLHVRVDRSLGNAERGRSALGDLLMRLHIYRCTADVSRCRTLLDELTVPAQECLEWRKILLEEGAVKRVFVQPNTVIVNGGVVINDYEPTVQGLIQSWAERQV
jgi:dipeptidyl-peptidase-3